MERIIPTPVFEQSELTVYMPFVSVKTTAGRKIAFNSNHIVAVGSIQERLPAAPPLNTRSFYFEILLHGTKEGGRVIQSDYFDDQAGHDNALNQLTEIRNDLLKQLGIEP